MNETAAIRTAVAELLEARGDRRLAAVVADAGVSLSSPEPWTMGARTVTAHHATLEVDAPTYVGLRADPAALGRIREAFESALRSPETALADLVLVLRLPVLGRSWQHAYRDAPAAPTPDPPSDPAVLAGAAALVRAEGDADLGAMLDRASLESADVPSSGGYALRRYVLRLDVADLVELRRDVDRAERARAAVGDAATSAVARVASVELAPRAAGAASRPREGSERRLAEALAHRGVVAFTVVRHDDACTLACIVDGELCLVDVARGLGEPTADQALVPRFGIGSELVADDEGAADVASRLVEIAGRRAG